ncbi:Fe-S cluster assembly iron-binding protein IscA [Microbacterium resistens]|uniref:Fe-S cluster assembly iron-binding protein IscA n=1 Tax=Microbacterium resistens TaxID=156977 RepID=A0ABU1S7G4_9MICO|nr:Fe-S cluster assembly protein HesB [Microbacterium resistens]MDR6865576.1 Fe-S cluster assembly iron-binding protein IscA [Microbacterium resistens]
MLTLTDNATAIVATLVNRQSDAEEAGLRIQTADTTGPAGESRLAVVVVPAPAPEDAVLDVPGAHVYLEEGAATVLSDKILDASVDEEGAVSFAVLPQPV